MIFIILIQSGVIMAKHENIKTVDNIKTSRVCNKLCVVGYVCRNGRCRRKPRTGQDRR